MIGYIIVAALAVIIVQLAALRVLLVTIVKMTRMITLMIDPDTDFDMDTAAEKAQLEIDIEAGKYG